MFNDFETKMSPDSNWDMKYIHIFRGIYISDSENEYKKGNKTTLNDENEFDIEEKTDESKKFNYYVLDIKSKNYEIKIRSNDRISLEYIIFHATLTDEKDIGRPLTFYPHLSNIESPLEEKRIKENNYTGFINLIIIALALSHLRLMYENYVKYGIILTPQNIFFFVAKPQNFIYFSLMALLICFSVIITYLTEVASSSYKTYSPFLLVHIVNLATLLVVPIYLHKFGIVSPLTGVFVLITVSILFMKLYSYIHFWIDVRIFITNKTRLIKKSATKENKLQEHMYKDIEEVIDNYPNNLRLADLLKFLIMPVLCFQYKYPKLHRRRKRVLINYFLEFFLCMILLMNSIKYIEKDDYLNILERMLKLAIPNVYGWILMFYAFFHVWLNFLAELTRFADRNFYKDWWNSLYIDEYWRNWNLPTHYWLMRHIYNPIRRRNIDKLTAAGVVFFVSAIVHEYIISGALGYLNYWAFIAMFANFPISIAQEILKRSKSINKQPQMLNVLFWISFCFLGQPLCVMLYFYNYYKQANN